MAARRMRLARTALVRALAAARVFARANGGGSAIEFAFVAMLLMLLLVGESVSPAAIADDYTRSEPELVVEFDERIREIEALGLDAEYTRCPPGFVAATAEYLDRRYGGVQRYLAGIGIDADKQGRIRRKLIFGGI